MANNIAPQTDISTVPNNTVAVLCALSPFLKALSADNVNPLAVVQIEAIGACFHINGDIAAKLPDLLVRTPSYRLERISHWVGWHAGDTGSTMAQSIGGMAGSLLSLALVEVYGEQSTGLLLAQLSSKILLPDRNLASMIQMEQVARTLSNKLSAIGFASHLAYHVMRIRHVYLNSGLQIPSTFLDRLTVETMVQFLHDLSRSLQDESIVLYVEGCKGIAHVVALVMALCPEDTWLMIENELIFQGQRRSIVISVKSRVATQFFVETILHGSDTRFPSEFVSVEPGREPFQWSAHLRWDGCLANALDLAFISAGAHSGSGIRQACADLTAAIVLSSDWRSPRKYDYLFGYMGFRNLLGALVLDRVRKTLSRVFLVQPSLESLDAPAACSHIRSYVKSSIPKSSCTCDECFYFVRRYSDRQPICPVAKLWETIANVITLGIAVIFVNAGENTCIRLSAATEVSKRLLYLIEQCVLRFTIPDTLGFCDDFFDGTQSLSEFIHSLLHSIILGLVGVECERQTVGLCSGSCSTFPLTIQNPVLFCRQNIEYALLDGRFHDGQNYYLEIISERCPERPGAIEPIIRKTSPIRPSGLGSHSSMVMTARGFATKLTIRTEVQISSKIISLDFLSLHLSQMSVWYAKECQHHRRAPLDEVYSEQVVTTSVAAPFSTSTAVGTVRRKLLSLALTHENPAAQFLCCTEGVQTLFQGDSCLNCAVKEAEFGEFEMLIQS